jgi:hypothetical protein
MVSTRKNLSLIKFNHTRKLTKGGAAPDSMVNVAEQLPKAFNNSNKKLTETPPLLGLAATTATYVSLGSAMVLPPTTLLTAGIADAALSVGSWIGGGGLIGLSGLGGPLITVITASMAAAYVGYSVARKNKMKSKIRHFIKNQMLATLDEINEKSKAGGLSDSKYPPLEHYDSSKANVKQFFVKYGIFTKLADIFMSMQSNMLHFYPSERLMYPIHFKNSTEDGPKNIPFSEEPYNSYPVGTNFVCFYDYLTSNEYLYFTSDQLNNGTTTSFLRLKFNADMWTSYTPNQIVNFLMNELQHGHLQNNTNYIPYDGDVESTLPSESAATLLQQNAEPSNSNSNIFVGGGTNDSINITVPLLPGLDIPTETNYDVKAKMKNVGAKMKNVGANISQNANQLAARTGNAAKTLANSAVITGKEKISKMMMKGDIFDFMKINNTDNRKFNINIDTDKNSEVEMLFAQNVIVLLQFPSFVKVIAERIKEFKSEYVKDFQSDANDEDDILINETDTVEGVQSGGGLFTPSMTARGNVIKSSKDKSVFKSLRTKTVSVNDKHSFIEFIYYSTYSFYRVFSKTLKVRESEMEKFFNDYIGDLMNMYKNNFSTIVNNSSVYISIARALAITFERKLGVAFNSSHRNLTLNTIDYNSQSTLNETGAIEDRLKKANLFSTDSFFNLKNKKIRDYIFKTYSNIQDLETAMDDPILGNRQRNVASRLDARFTKEILGKNPTQQALIESQQVRTALNSIFKGHFGMFKNILD